MGKGGKPFFSVIIPAFNEEKTISHTLESVLRQNFPRRQYEIIVVNNNSTDKTAAIVKKFPAVKLIHEPKQGYVYALKRGAKEARGEILVFTDADTIVPPDWLSQYQKAYQDPRVVVVGGAANFQPKFGLIFLVQAFLNLFGFLTKVASGFNFSLRRDIYEKIGGLNPQINFHADTDLILRAKKEGKAIFLLKNRVITSSRHYRGLKGIGYVSKGIINALWLFLFKKTLFWHFGEVR
jgi:glycosyltransferase involved in cell wall biosynthesis